MRRPMITQFSFALSSILFFGCQSSQTGLENLQQASDNATQQQTILVKPRGYALPTSFSIAPHTKESTLSTVGDLIGTILSDGNQLHTESDYYQAVERSHVHEPLLEQFGLIDNILFGLAQTHYDERENVNIGPYSSRVYVRDQSSLEDVSTYQDWVIESEVETNEGETGIHTVRAWIASRSKLGHRSMHVELIIYSPAYVDAEGAVSDFGQWDLKVSFPAQPNDFLVAEVRYENGEASIKINSSETRWLESANKNVVFIYQGELHRGRDRGFGKFRYSDLDYCRQLSSVGQVPCDSGVPVRDLSYAYNAKGMSIQKDGGSIFYRDRKQTVQIPMQYGLYNSMTGEDIKNSFQFEFPISYIDSMGEEHWARYVTENGRHYLTGLTGALPAVDSAVIRRQIAKTAIERPYQVAHHTLGTLYQVESSRDGFNNELEHWVWEADYDRHWILKYDADDAVWRRCVAIWQEAVGCDENDQGWVAFDDMASLAHIDHQRLLNYDLFSKTTNLQLVYLNDARAHSGVGFYEASYHAETGQLTSIGALWRAADGEIIEANIQGSLLLQKETDNNQWHRFRVNDSLLSSGVPITSGDSEPHDWQPGAYHFRQPGRQLMLRVQKDGSESVQHEHWHALHPNTVPDKEIAGQLLLRSGEDNSQLYSLQGKEDHSHFMSLVYANGVKEGELVTHSVWDLWQVNSAGSLIDAEGNVVAAEQLQEADVANQVGQYRWVYRQDGSSQQNFFKDSIGDWVQLASPRSFEPVRIAKQNVALKFDSQLQGLMHPLRDLTKLEWQLNSDMGKHLVQIRDEIELQDSESGIKYLAKPLIQFNLAQHAGFNSSAALDLDQANNIDLSELPEAEQISLPNMPAVTAPKYVGGLRAE